MKEIKEIQRKVGVSADGVWGPITQKAVNRALGYNWNTTVKSLQNRLGVVADGEVGPVTAKAVLVALEGSHKDSGGRFADTLVKVATKDLGIRETSHNQGEGIAKFWTATSYPDGYRNREPYCAAAVCYWIKEALKGESYSFQLPKTPLAFGFCKWARREGVWFEENPSQVKRGDILVFRFSHVGIATEDSKGATVKTVEANTSGTSSGDQRDGGGVWRKTRNLSEVAMAIRL